MMRIHFVTEPGRWILRPLCEQFSQQLPDATISTRPDNKADVNVFVNYALYKPVPTKTIGYFTHRERGKKLAARFDFVARRVNWCVAMCEKTAAYLPAEKTTIIQAWPEGRFHKDRLVLGVVGKEQKSGRKQFDLIPAIRQLHGVEVRVTGGTLSDEALPAFYRGIDYLLVLSNNEGGPMPVLEALAMGKPVIAPNVGFCWRFPVLRYGTEEELLALIRGLVLPANGWQMAAGELSRLCKELLAEKPKAKKGKGFMKKWFVFICALACLVATPLVINPLARKLGKTLGEERQARAVLYLCADAALVATIFCFWLWG